MSKKEKPIISAEPDDSFCCFHCKHGKCGDCKAFPYPQFLEIPDDAWAILLEKGHNKVLPGQVGDFVFEPKD